MKRPTAKRSEKGMRFFTPKLYLRFNSPDDAVADQADEDWEEALERYQHHLETIRPKLPPQVRKLADLCLHDAELLSLDEEKEPAVAILSLRQDQTILNFVYFLTERVRRQRAKRSWPFAKARKHWLYDEIDRVSYRNAGFIHRILFSDGSVVEIPFVAVAVAEVSLHGCHTPANGRS